MRFQPPSPSKQYETSSKEEKRNPGREQCRKVDQIETMEEPVTKRKKVRFLKTAICEFQVAVSD